MKRIIGIGGGPRRVDLAAARISLAPQIGFHRAWQTCPGILVCSELDGGNAHAGRTLTDLDLLELGPRQRPLGQFL